MHFEWKRKFSKHYLHLNFPEAMRDANSLFMPPKYSGYCGKQCVYFGRLPGQATKIKEKTIQTHALLLASFQTYELSLYLLKYGDLCENIRYY